jgi:hypothetical protein
MRSLSLTIVAARQSPTSRAYLKYLNDAGWMPQKVLLVDFVGNNAWLQKFRSLVGDRWAQWILRPQAPAWPPDSARLRAYCDLVQRPVSDPIDYFSSFDFAERAKEIESVVATDYADPVLHRALRRQPVKKFLYTDGGRVPETLLADPQMKFFHIHPGLVPDVRGSDGLLWSLLTRGRPGASCFFMDSGIDTGDLILTREFDRPRIPGIKAAADEDFATLYLALLHAYDPHLRAQLMVDVVRACDGRLDEIRAHPQPDAGATYLSMHPRLRRRVVSELES